MLRKVLVPTDFSPGYEKAVVAFEKINEIPAEEVIVLHVVDEEELELLQDISELKAKNITGQELERELMELAERRLETETERLTRAFRTNNVRTIVRVGRPWEEIVKVGEEENVSLIFLPSHGKLGFSSELFGSTTMRVLKRTTRPVLLIKTKG